MTGRKLPQTPILTLLKLYLFSLIVFSIFRIVLFITEIDHVSFSEDGLGTILNAFLMGVRFDLVITGYILMLPALVIFVLDLFKTKSEIASSILFVYIFLLFTLAFIISSSDIPYFNHFFERFSVGAFAWIDSPAFVFKMITQEPRYYIIVIPAIILIVLTFKVQKKIIWKNTTFNFNTWAKIPLYLLLLGVMFLGIRGRITEKSPIRVGTAYFSGNSFLNQMGLNPVFTFMRSYFDLQNNKNKPINLIDSELAKKVLQEHLGIESGKFESPVSRVIEVDSVASNKPNVVIIIMESMSAAKMARHGNKNNLTPFLDTLSKKSIYFENTYTNGFHTFNGIFSTLFSFPAIYRQHSLKKMRKYNGISSTLKAKGYQTVYFTTHDGQFDNVEGFLIDNDFNKVISQKNYPADKIETTLGVPDDFMLKFSLPVLDELSNNGKPFFATFMTASDHGPYYIPEYFTPKNQDIKNQIVEYADWSLKEFIHEASSKPWFNNTYFIFIADHGAPMNPQYDIPLDYYHTPLIVYAPEIIDSTKTVSCIASQMDVFPTIMGLLNLPYLNNTLGIDLLKESRPYTVINGDDKLGVIDNEFLLILKDGEKPKLFKYRNLDKTNYVDQLSDKAAEMEIYGKSTLQVYQDMMLNNQTYIKQ
jgi:phosphoglycerol transferase MdoB-like AlkP superfamily enzyme